MEFFRFVKTKQIYLLEFRYDVTDITTFIFVGYDDFLEFSSK